MSADPGLVTVSVGLTRTGAVLADPGSVTVSVGLTHSGAVSADPGSVTVGIWSGWDAVCMFIHNKPSGFNDTTESTIFIRHK